MSKGAQKTVSKTKNIPNPNEYVKALYGECKDWAFDEEKTPTLKGLWRSEVFKVDAHHPFDLEIGTGNGFHFAHFAASNPGRSFLGIELKYKPLIQSIRRALRTGATNMRICRYNAVLVDQLFEKEELNDVYIHFPDPWEKSVKHRLIQDDFLLELFKVQKPGGKIYFKTDSRDYYEWALEKFKNSPYVLEGHTDNLHQSKWAAINFVTHFEALFTSKGLPTHFALLVKPEAPKQ